MGWVWVGFSGPDPFKGGLNEEAGRCPWLWFSGRGAQVLQDNVLLILKTGSPKLSSSTPGQQTNAPPFSRTAPITPASRLTPGYDRTTSRERFRASRVYYFLVADAPAIIAWAVHFPRPSPWLCFPRARENRSVWVTDQKPGDGNVHFVPYHSMVGNLREACWGSWALGWSDF